MVTHVPLLRKLLQQAAFVAIIKTLASLVLGSEEIENLYLWMWKLHFPLQSQTAKLLKNIKNDYMKKVVEKSKTLTLGM
jgi:hypothetical protein